MKHIPQAHRDCPYFQFLYLRGQSTKLFGRNFSFESPLNLDKNKMNFCKLNHILSKRMSHVDTLERLWASASIP